MVSYLAPERGIFCNRTLNLRSIRAIGYDMDYTLLHYRVQAWEQAAFDHARRFLAGLGWPVADLEFDPGVISQGLVFDLELGNLCKATRFGYVIRAQHGTRALDFDDLRRTYANTAVSLSSPRFEFMNTLFELSRASLFTQLVDLLDKGGLPNVVGYAALYRGIDLALEESHAQGALKAEIIRDPDRFLEPDPELALTLLDQRHAGKQLMLITNSDWAYTHPMMELGVNPYLPAGTTWRDLFDIVIVSANKPRFFLGTDDVYRVVDEERALLSPHRGALEPGSVYFGGNARLVEQSLGLDSHQILYVGDHLFGDVHVSKDELRWRTALVLREIEAEITAMVAFADDEARLVELMAAKTLIEHELAELRLARQRLQGGYAPAGSTPAPETLDAQIDSLFARGSQVDHEVAPLARAASELGNTVWGPLMRAGNDKSLYARQVERYADVYTSRVSNLGLVTPYAYLRASRGSLPHDDVSRASPTETSGV